jgi:predicted negative regulator of RcsB-dependent stress response
MDWIEKNLARAVALAIAAAALILLALFGWHEWQATRTARAEARLATGQAGAALASGQDAANTIGNRMDTDAATDTVTRENDHAIRTAPGADAPVDAALRDAALRGLCRRAAYRHDAKCLQHADPR